MGKDNWYWGGRRSSTNKRKPATDIPSGCMCAVFQAFDFHPFNFSINQQHQQQQQNTFNSASPIQITLPKGAEAPRNSLESEDGTSSSISKEDNFKIPKNIRIKTGSDKSFNDLNSPGTKTPTLVARLMGLELLPDANSPSSSSSSSLSTPNRQGHYHNRSNQDKIKIMKHRHSTDSVIMRSSLPETPRLSSEKTSYVEHRLSLQINKENRNLGEDLETPRSSFSKRKFFDDNNNCRSPSHYARQIVKQVKESVSRKVGIDITNTVKNREQVKEDFVGQMRFKKALKPLTKPLEESNQGNKNTSHSPRLSRFNDTNHKHSPKKDLNQNTLQVLKQSSPPPVVNIDAQVSRVSTKPKLQAMSEKEDKKTFPKCKKTAPGNLSPRNNNKPPQSSSIRNKQEESFILRPSSSTTKANDIKTKSKKTHPLSNNSVPNLLPLKTHPSPLATKIPQKQVNDDVQEAKNMSQLFNCSRQKYTLATRGTTNGSIAAAGAEEEGPEYQYITTILSRTGIHRATITSLQHFQWFSSTHPLDPSIFHRLELYPTTNSLVSIPNNHKDINFTQKNQVGPRCNRRLLFDLVDEVLSEILTKPKCYRGLLLETVWKKVRSFPRAKCEVLEDIDGLIEMKMVMDEVKEEEEEEEKLVAEIEGKVLEMLVNETLTVMVGPYKKNGVVL
ncbi:unnamed protein product [Trifolium pratense]|uniref:Uncharacterized protein n=1 Tax=Trifolium pratense TaxID=57577 RepID=A0ACB0IDM1_TRIPR|nr:unnamed protein product [Trifolium pratense]